MKVFTMASLLRENESTRFQQGYRTLPAPPAPTKEWVPGAGDSNGFVQPDPQNRNQVAYWQSVFVLGKETLLMGKFQLQNLV